MPKKQSKKQQPSEQLLDAELGDALMEDLTGVIGKYINQNISIYEVVGILDTLKLHIMTLILEAKAAEEEAGGCGEDCSCKERKPKKKE